MYWPYLLTHVLLQVFTHSRLQFDGQRAQQEMSIHDEDMLSMLSLAPVIFAGGLEPPG